MNKYLGIGLGASAIFVSLGLALNTVSAHGTGYRTNQSMVSRLAESLGKSESEVQTVFDQMHQERQIEMTQLMQEKLQLQVEAGNLTSEQMQLILNKHQEFQTQRQTERESFSELTPDERRDKMLEHHQEMETWASENGISLDYLQLDKSYGSKGQGRGMHRNMMN